MFWLGVVCGSAFAGPCLEYAGPRKALLFTSVYLLGPILIQALSTSRGMLLAGKMLTGLALGALKVVAANYVAETSPARLRATFSAAVAMGVVLGLVFGIASGSPLVAVLSDWGSWRQLFALQAVLPVVSILLLPFSTTSPVYLVKQGRPEEASKVIRKLSRSKESGEIAAKLAVTQYNYAKEIEHRLAVGKVTAWDVIRDPTDRRRTLICIGLFLAYQAGGSSFLGQGLYFLQLQGLPIKLATSKSSLIWFEAASS